MRRNYRFGSVEDENDNESRCEKLLELLKSDDYNIKKIIQALKENSPPIVMSEDTSVVSTEEINDIKEALKKYASILTIYEQFIDNEDMQNYITDNAIKHVNASFKIANNQLDDDDDEELMALYNFIQGLRERFKNSSAFGRRRKVTNTKKRMTKKGVTKKGVTKKGVTKKKGSR